MLQLNYIREHRQEVIDRLAIKNFDGTSIVPQIIQLDDRRKVIQKQLDDNQAQSNILAKEIGILYQSGKSQEANQKKEQTVKLKNLAKEQNLQLDKQRETWKNCW